MASKKPAHATAADTTEAVDTFLRTLEHPHADLVVAIRRAILGADRTIAEGIKWNAPSYRTSEYFATTNLREKKGVGVVFHRGAKVRDVPEGGVAIDDPTKLLTWLGKDRAMVVFTNVADLESKRDAFVRLVRAWLPFV